MKNRIIILTVAAITSSICLFSLTYSNLRDAYGKSEKEKLKYCEKYNEQKDRVLCFIYEIQYKDSIINQMKEDYKEQWRENQIFSSMLDEIENEPGGHRIVKKLWLLQKQNKEDE